MTNSSPRTGYAATVIRGENHSPNDGISACHGQVLIEDPKGNVASSRLPAVRVIARTICGGLPVVHAEPIDACPAGRIGYMGGGAYVQIPAEAAQPLGLPAFVLISLHDRIETPSEYAALSSD